MAIEAVHRWPGMHGENHTTTVVLPEAFRPIAGKLRDALREHCVWQYATERRRNPSGGITGKLGIYSAMVGGPDPVSGGGVSFPNAERLDRLLSAIIVELWQHCYGDTPPSDDVKPSKYVLRLAKAVRHNCPS